ncbi:MAG: TusE/DsrC/DsvC family sulfur relay protein [Actinomycetales bacterium]|nr:TusE/DsrC/DsvC family sulfur relay protein [Tetrasphaera sp.]NLX00382.1 TusE/DsrC/DsvC family sulfur relay protein [Actinomycetales bacterium]
MPTNTINGRSFEVDEEGFFTDRDEWSEDLAKDLAALIGIELDEEHLAPLRFMRQDAAVTGVTPTLRRLQTVGGFDIKSLFALYPGKPAKKMSWLAGLRKPVGCV